MPWYNTGTVAVTNNSATVTGAETAWTDNVDAGQSFIGPDGLPIEIASVVSATSITLATPYRGATASGQPYRIMPVQGYLRDLATQAAELVLSFATVRDGIGQGIFPSGSVGTPGFRFAGDEDTGFYRPGANALAAVIGGGEAWRLTGTGLGIGTPSPADRLHIVGGGIRVEAASYPKILYHSSSNGAGLKKWQSYIDPSGNFKITSLNDAENAEAGSLVIQPNGNTGVGISAPQSRLHVEGQVYSSTTGRAGYRVYNGGNASEWWMGQSSASDHAFRIQTLVGGAYGYGVTLDTTLNFYPNADNVGANGLPGNRWSVIFAAAGTINTSDEREKQWHGFSGELKDKVRRIARAILDELGWFQFLSSIEEKGEDDARWHFGVRAQVVWGFAAAEGLCAPLIGEGAEQRPDPSWTGPPPPAWLCWDIWEDQYEPIMEEQQVGTQPVVVGQEPTGLLDANGAPIVRDIIEEQPVMEMVEVGQRLVQAAGNRFGLRLDQMGLLLDWELHEQASEQRAAIADLTARLEALEAA